LSLWCVTRRLRHKADLLVGMPFTGTHRMDAGFSPRMTCLTNSRSCHRPVSNQIPT